MRLPSIVLVVIALLATSAGGEVAKGLRYTVPSGWSAAERDGVQVVAPTNLQNGELMIAILLGVQPSAGSPDEQIATLAASINTEVKVAKSSDVVTTKLDGGRMLYIKNFDVESKEMGPHARMVTLLVRGDQRAAILFLITNDNVLQKYQAGMQALLKSFRIDAAAVTSAPVPPSPVTPGPAKPTAPPATTTTPKPGAAAHLPTGDTPDLYPGSTGWLPSGRGVPIPVARVVKGSPEGMWWHFQSQGSRTAAITTIFLADGTRATNPRPGSGTLFDLEGQRKAKGTTGVGTFNVKDGKITQTHDGFTHTESFKFGSGDSGAWIEIGGGRHYPLSPVSANDLVGTWKSAGHTYMFRTDNTLEGGGTWQLDGYLLGIELANGARYITTVGRTDKLLIIGSSSYSRE